MCYTPKVSILIPCYNSDKFIAETLRCCENQTYSNIEVVVVDDGSTDDSYLIAKKFESAIIKVYSQNKLGACAARNLAFEKSSGKYIIYLDSDDLISESYVELLVSALCGQDDSTIATAQWDRFYTDISNAKFPQLSIYKNYSNAFDLLLEMWSTGQMFACSSYLVPRDLIIKAGFWDNSVLKNQDGEFFSRVLIHANKIIHVPDAKFYYRTGSYMSVSKASSYEKISSMFDTFVSYRKHALEHEDSNRVRKALAVNFTLFIYLYGNQYQKLYSMAKKEIANLGVGYILHSQPTRVKLMCHIIGFETFMAMRKVLFNR